MSVQTGAGTSGYALQTADPTLLNRPFASLADCLAIEELPLEQRLGIEDFNQRIAFALAANDPNATALYYIPDGDVERPPVTVSFSQLADRISRTATLLRAHGVNQSDAVAVLMPAVPDIYWALLGTMAAGIMYPINWMAGPKQTLHFLRKGNVKAILALGPTPGFTIWENVMSVLTELPSNIPVWSVQGLDGKMLAEFDLDASLASQTPNASIDRRFPTLTT